MSPNQWLDGVESRLAFEFSVYPIKLWNLQLSHIASYSDNADANYVSSAMAGPLYLSGKRSKRAKNPKKGNNVKKSPVSRNPATVYAKRTLNTPSSLLYPI
jgi:hypothetical protein